MRHSKPTLTIFTDASLNSKTAGWAGWAVGDGREQVTASGPAIWSKSSNVVELEAIARMLLHLSSTRYLWPSDKSILIQSDSLSALQALLRVLPRPWASNRNTGADIKTGRSPKPEELPWCQVVMDLTRHCDVVYLRHVKAHKGGGTARSWVNETCDRLAKEAARATA